ncbi:MAG: hypothetical protein CMP10_17525 [Zetaproteobacteria bacterium]|nr:hypothetical protein [Pseudobdellovibrionaceae bacterium]|tara:strand:- start:1198 stop:2001 length:804 start_codon:yes stop_codon:yes gene_type:complete
MVGYLGRIIGGLWFISLIQGCAQLPAESQPAIYGGQKTKAGDWDNTVAITKNGYIYCSGTIIHPRLVITAAHCINGVNQMKGIHVYMGNGSSNRKVSPNYPVARGFRNPKYGADNEWQFDVAFLEMAEDLPIDPAKITSILYQPEEIETLLQVGKTSTIVGFGFREDDGVGEKYQAVLPMIALDDNEIHMGGQGLDSCNYDSGGPAFAQLPNGEWRFFGVVSRGLHANCGEGGIWGMMHHHLCWLKKASRVQLDIDLSCDQAGSADD